MTQFQQQQSGQWISGIRQDDNSAEKQIIIPLTLETLSEQYKLQPKGSISEL